METRWLTGDMEKKHAARPLRPRGRGQAAVEFALVAIVLLALLYGIIEISRLLLINAELENAAREGAHYAALHPDVSGTTLRTTVMAPRLTLINPNSSDFRVDNPSFPNGGIGAYFPVHISVAYTYTSLISIMPDMSTLSLKPLGPLPMGAASTRLIENGR